MNPPLPHAVWPVPVFSLQKADFSTTNLNFRGIKLCLDKSQKCTTKGIKFPKQDAGKGADFTGADLGYADVAGTDFRAVDLSVARLDRTQNLQTAWVVDEEASKEQSKHDKLRTCFRTDTWLPA